MERSSCTVNVTVTPAQGLGAGALLALEGPGGLGRHHDCRLGAGLRLLRQEPSLSAWAARTCSTERRHRERRHRDGNRPAALWAFRLGAGRDSERRVDDDSEG